MPFDKSAGGNWLKLPKVGETTDYSEHGAITEIKKVEGGKFNFTKKETVVLPDGQSAKIDKDLGYHYDIVFANSKVLSVSSWKPFYAMTEAGLVEGCRFILDHAEKGVWTCRLI
jgi:hypothetical protein